MLLLVVFENGASLPQLIIPNTLSPKVESYFHHCQSVTSFAILKKGKGQNLNVTVVKGGSQ